MVDDNDKATQQPHPEPLEAPAFRQFMGLFVVPEIKRRQQAGIAPKPLELAKFQIVFSIDGTPPLVRLNDEVKAQARVKLKEGVTLAKDQLVARDEIEALEVVDLPDAERDHGHFTAIIWDGSWLVSFSFIYNRRTAKELTELGQQFLTAAEDALKRGHLPVFLDNLFSAAELAAKACCVCWLPDQKFKDGANHKAVIARYGQYAKVGNASTEHSSLLSRLHQQRAKARYMQGKFELAAAEAEELLGEVKVMLQAAANAVV